MRCPSCDHDNRSERRFCARMRRRARRGLSRRVARRTRPARSSAAAAAPGCSPSPTALGVRGASPEPEADVANRRAPPTDRPLLRPRRLDAALAAARRRGVARRGRRATSSAAAAAVERFGGHVAQYLGDGLLVYFGWPTAREDDPERAIRAGLAICRRDGAAERGARRRTACASPCASACTPGPVVIADGGARCFGETANIAARVQGAAEPDTVVITAATQRLVAGHLRGRGARRRRR